MNFDKTRVKLFPNFTRHHLITQPPILKRCPKMHQVVRSSLRLATESTIILQAFTLMWVLLRYQRLDPWSGPTFAKISFNYRYVTYPTFRCLAGGILENYNSFKLRRNTMIFNPQEYWRKMTLSACKTISLLEWKNCVLAASDIYSKISESSKVNKPVLRSPRKVTRKKRKKPNWSK